MPRTTRFDAADYLDSEERQVAYIAAALETGATVDPDDLFAWVRPPRFARLVAPSTMDWDAAKRSVAELAALSPTRIAAGHGRPIDGVGRCDEFNADLHARS
jgi:hypothetical protein